jgi:hypothetical protein
MSKTGNTSESEGKNWRVIYALILGFLVLQIAFFAFISANFG